MPKEHKQTFDKPQLEAGVARMIALRKVVEGMPEITLDELTEKTIKKQPSKLSKKSKMKARRR